jgi:hypothetical protein
MPITRELGELQFFSTPCRSLTRHDFAKGGYERFSLSRTLVGSPPVLTFVAVLERDTPLSTLSRNAQRAIEHIVAQYPLLRCIVSDTRSRHPSFTSDTSFDETKVLNVISSETDLPAGELVCRELVAAKTLLDLETGPLWRITIHKGPATTCIALTLNHVICDGLGGRNLTGDFLRYLFSEVTESVPAVHVLPPALESTIDVSTPRISEGWNPPAYWPNPPPFQPYTRDIRLELLPFTSADVGRLKAAGRAHGVATLHPLLITIMLTAVSATWAKDTSIQNVHVGTAISLRDISLGHPYATGNYVGDLAFTYPTVDRSSVFWDIARDYARKLVDPASVEKARRTWGFLANIPDPDRLPVPNKTGWEIYIESRLHARNPFGASAEISNLGVMNEDVPGVKEVIFAQAPSPIWSAITLNVRTALRHFFTC